jgi:hypothetical protein
VREVPGSNPGRALNIFQKICSAFPDTNLAYIKFPVMNYLQQWFYGVMVSTQDSESCDPSSNLGRTLLIFKKFCINCPVGSYGIEDKEKTSSRDSSVGRALD